MKSELMCVLCPNSCHITVEYDQPKNIQGVNGNKCRRGYEFAAQEIVCPLRTLTFNIYVENGDLPFVSTKSMEPVPLSDIPKLCETLRNIKVNAPVTYGKVLYDGRHYKMIATRNVCRTD